MSASLQLRLNASVSDNTQTALRGSNNSGTIDYIVSRGDASTPAIDVIYAETLALVGGTLAVDLTALSVTGGTTLDLTGQIVYGYVVKNNGANNMTIVAAATTGYALFSATGGTVVHPGKVAMNDSDDGFGTVAAGAKDLTVTGTAAQTFDIILWTGPAA